MSVQFSSIQSKQTFLLPRGPVVLQPAGNSQNSGHNEYLPSSFTSTKYSPSSSSNGFVIAPPQQSIKRQRAFKNISLSPNSRSAERPRDRHCSSKRFDSTIG